MIVKCPACLGVGSFPRYDPPFQCPVCKGAGTIDRQPAIALAGFIELERAVIEAAINWREGLDAQYESVTTEEMFEADRRQLDDSIDALIAARNQLSLVESSE